MRKYDREYNGGKKTLMKIAGVILVVTAFFFLLLLFRATNGGYETFGIMTYIRMFIFLSLLIFGIVLVVKSE